MVFNESKDKRKQHLSEVVTFLKNEMKDSVFIKKIVFGFRYQISSKNKAKDSGLRRI